MQAHSIAFGIDVLSAALQQTTIVAHDRFFERTSVRRIQSGSRTLTANTTIHSRLRASAGGHGAVSKGAKPASRSTPASLRTVVRNRRPTARTAGVGAGVVKILRIPFCDA